MTLNLANCGVSFAALHQVLAAIAAIASAVTQHLPPCHPSSPSSPCSSHHHRGNTSSSLRSVESLEPAAILSSFAPSLLCRAFATLAANAPTPCHPPALSSPRGVYLRPLASRDHLLHHLASESPTRRHLVIPRSSALFPWCGGCAGTYDV
jgi:hypothetical protein